MSEGQCSAEPSKPCSSTDTAQQTFQVCGQINLIYLWIHEEIHRSWIESIDRPGQDRASVMWQECQPTYFLQSSIFIILRRVLLTVTFNVLFNQNTCLCISPIFVIINVRKYVYLIFSVFTDMTMEIFITRIHLECTWTKCSMRSSLSSTFS